MAELEPALVAELEIPPPRADEWMARYASMADLPPEGATEEELEKVQELLALVKQDLEEKHGMKADGMNGWWRHFFLRATLLRFLRGRDGNVEGAKDMVINTMGWFYSLDYWEKVIRKFETEDSEKMRRTIAQYSAQGHFGLDKRGAPVIYNRVGLQDTGGIIRETDHGVYTRSCLWNIEAMQDLNYKASLDAGVYFMGLLQVLDCQGMSFSRSKDTVGFLMWLTTEMLNDHFPEFASKFLIVNVPWYFNWGWKLVSKVMPKRTIGKCEVCGTGFMSTLETYVDRSQIPAFLGGDSPEPWPFGEGGDVPDKAGKGLPPPMALHVKSKESLEFEAKPGKLFVWEFRVLKHDLLYEAMADGKVYEASRKVTAEDSWQSGQCMAKASPVRISVTFDNSFSMLRSKDIEYRTYEEDLPSGYDPAEQEAPL